jgi:cytochrome c oxidase subunit 2
MTTVAAYALAASADTREEFDRLLAVYAPVALAVFAIVVLTLGFVVWRYRARPGRTPSQRSTAPRVEATYAIVLTVIAGLLLWRTLVALQAVDPVVPAPTAAQAQGVPRPGPSQERAAVEIEVIAAQWNWRFAYPGGVVVQGAGPDSLPTLVVPAGVPVRFRMTSLDVVHAFWIPAARYKYDALPGRTSVFDMRFDPGVEYDNARCSEFCGTYHATMRFAVEVRAPGEFQAWLARRQEEAARR